MIKALKFIAGFLILPTLFTLSYMAQQSPDFGKILGALVILFFCTILGIAVMVEFSE